MAYALLQYNKIKIKIKFFISQKLQNSLCFLSWIEMIQNKVHAPLLVEGFPMVLRTQFQRSHYNKQNKQSKTKQMASFNI